MANLSPRQQAVMYVTRLYSGELTSREEIQLRHWRQEHASHEAEWQAALSTYDMTSDLYRNDPNVIPTIPSHGWLTWFASAASIGFVSLLLMLQSSVFVPASLPESAISHIGTGVLQAAAPQITPEVVASPSFRMTSQLFEPDSLAMPYKTEIGEVSTISLTDGSELTLNTNTQLSIEFTDAHRRVTLSSGEVFFNIAKDTQRPFIIDTGAKQIEVLGTQFSVRKLSDESLLKVVVLEGEVAVYKTESGDATELAGPALLAGDIASFDKNNQVIQQNQLTQASQAQAWRQGIVRFDNESLEKVVFELNRYRTHKMSISDAHIKQLRLSGVFHLADGENIVSALEGTLPILVKRDAQQIIITKR